LKANIENRLIWLKGKIVPLNEATINVLSPTSQFGTNVFEGIRCYWNKKINQLYGFKLNDHYKRLKNSVKMMRLDDKYSISEMEKGLIDIIKANKYKEDIAIRQTIFLDGFGSWSSTGPVNMFISPIKKKKTYDSKQGIKCCVSSWERISDKNMSPRIKVGANYVNSRMAQLEALENGYDSAIFMNNQGKIAEGPGSCIFIVRDNILITPPLTASVLESITRSTIIKIAEKELNIKTIERDIDRTELYISDEIFLCGSAMEVVSVLNVDGIFINKNIPGKITEKIKEMYFKIVRGEMEKYINWLTPIY